MRGDRYALSKRVNATGGAALYEMQSERLEIVHRQCMSPCHLSSYDFVVTTRWIKICATRRPLKGTSFAQSEAMIVSAHHTDHQWPGKLGRLSPAMSQTIHITEGATTLWQMITKPRNLGAIATI